MSVKTGEKLQLKFNEFEAAAWHPGCTTLFPQEVYRLSRDPWDSVIKRFSITTRPIGGTQHFIHSRNGTTNKDKTAAGGYRN
jgi:hypothetical protein